MRLPIVARCFGPAERPGWILAVAVLVGVMLFVGYHRERWRKGLVPLNRAQTRAGEGLVIRSDGLGYYAWLRSLLIDGDWSFDNEFDEHNMLGDFVPPPTWRTPIGRRALPWSVGPACWWALAVVPAHLGLVFLEDWGLPWAADGYSLPYQLLVGSGTLLAAGLGLYFLYGICRHFARPQRAALAAALLTLGTTIVFYSTIEVSMAHGAGTMAVAALTWYWLRTYGSINPRRWLLVGVLVGMAALMRWQLVTFAVLPLGESAVMLRAFGKKGDSPLDLGGQSPFFLNGGRLHHVLARLTLAALGAFVGFLPQMLAWRCVYGQWLAAPLATEPHWLTPALGELLLAQDRGLFYWTPLALLACLGYVCLPRCRGHAPAAATEPALLLLMAFLVQTYVLASLWGGQVYLGVAFGFRHLTEALVALAPGLALLLEKSEGKTYRTLCVVSLALVAWNLLLIAQYRYGLLPAAGGADLATMAGNALRLLVRKKGLLLGQVLIGPVLLAWLITPPRRGAGNAGGASGGRSWGTTARQTIRRRCSGTGH